jgi:hypothetical protein
MYLQLLPDGTRQGFDNTDQKLIVILSESSDNEDEMPRSGGRNA